VESWYLEKYLKERKIPMALGQRYLKEMKVRLGDTSYKMLGFANNSGGYALNAPTGLKASTKQGVSLIGTDGRQCSKSSSKAVAVFEGFFNFLSWMVMQGRVSPSCDVAVLNSVTNLPKAKEFIAAHERVLAFLDNDKAGRDCLENLRGFCQDAEVKDMSALYANVNDLNDFLKASKGYSAEMKLEECPEICKSLG